MNLKYIIYIMFILHRNVNAVEKTEDTEIYKMTDKVFTCSKWLSAIIYNFCNNVYKVVKRDTSLLDKLTPKDLLKIKNKRREFADVRWRRVRRQVASECCEKPCTVGNIIMYCPDDAKLLIENPNLFD
ncbi:uncharacterized protein LOC125065301 [Vanessa atalanta]|uniref:uncharacterized protein LOC125065301 n=1 Tax=Vanessa atalanta TaxID=42275 RepID=UPI001FCD5185|nr:uncharacterized protein LOC125065301 [Vanessa atalanta]